jgi:hypothetical protein
MKTLTTGAGSYLTGDDIADAVLEYWRALTRDRQVDIVDIPFLDACGCRSRAQLAIGWALPLAVVASSSTATLTDPEVVRSLHARQAPRRGDSPFFPDEFAEFDGASATI